MTRKDYILIAEALRQSRRDHEQAPATSLFANSSKTVLDNTFELIATALQADNPRFDREHFLAVVRGEKDLNSRPAKKKVTDGERFYYEDPHYIGAPQAIVTDLEKIPARPQRRSRILKDSEFKDFDTSTVEGLTRAENYQARLNNKYIRVTVKKLDLNRVRIFGAVRMG